MAARFLFIALSITATICSATFFQQQTFEPLRPSSLASSSLSSFTLKSIYHRFPNYGPTANQFIRKDISPQENYNEQSSTLRARSQVGTAYIPANRDDLFALRTKSSSSSSILIRQQQHQSSSVTATPVLVPDVEDHETVLTLGEMSYNAYTELGGQGDWYDLENKWRLNSTFGWKSDGMRGHVFGNADNSHLIISFKGTSAGFWREPTSEKDRLNDNLLFSCCCAKVGRGWTPVCDCNENGKPYQCNQACLDHSIDKTELYFDYAAHIYMDVADRYPDATIWFTGHSLGGAIAALLGQTFGVPAVTFESPGDRLAAQRLHLPRAPGAKDMPIWHFGHTADPIFIGVCTGPLSGCYYGGFAMEARCHTGKVCSWDTVKDNGWRVNIAYHRIATVIETILKKPDEFPLPKCKIEEDNCEDCALWTFKDPRDDVLFSYTY